MCDLGISFLCCGITVAFSAIPGTPYVRKSIRCVRIALGVRLMKLMHKMKIWRKKNAGNNYQDKQTDIHADGQAKTPSGNVMTGLQKLKHTIHIIITY